MARATRGAALWQTVVGAVGLVVVVWVGGDLYDIVTSSGERPTTGSGGHVPPVQHGPPGGGPAGQDTDDGELDSEIDGGEQTPPSEGQHDPSQFDHG
jgi:hypothetical protein